jgi:hypothetical protein
MPVLRFGREFILGSACLCQNVRNIVVKRQMFEVTPRVNADCTGVVDA